MLGLPGYPFSRWWGLGWSFDVSPIPVQAQAQRPASHRLKVVASPSPGCQPPDVRPEPATTNTARVISTATGGNKIGGVQGKDKTTNRLVNVTREDTAGFEMIEDPYSRYAPVEGDHDDRWDDC